VDEEKEGDAEVTGMVAVDVMAASIQNVKLKGTPNCRCCCYENY
jgi:hypothetical protein